jgi:hypothetical protein
MGCRHLLFLCERRRLSVNGAVDQRTAARSLLWFNGAPRNRGWREMLAQVAHQLNRRYCETVRWRATITMM